MVLGEPGAGKSVALRKLCRELLDEVQASSRLPIYVNLKEWRPGLPWTPATPPDVLQLKNFILANIRRRVPLSARFLGEFFDRLADYGHIFFILDSFDEIPVLLDVDESSWLIRELSAAATDLLAGGSYARGVLASRHYRRPRLTLTRYRQLEVRAFLEEKIAAAIDRATAQSEKVKQAVFVARPDLGAVIRNPFLLGLLLDFVDINPGKLPESIMDLYRSFVAQRLAEGAEQLREHGLSEFTVREHAEAIAREMFDAGSFGLEIPLATLVERLPNQRIEVTAELLAILRIGRISPGSRAFTFVHRRFNEYFLVNRFRLEPNLVPLEAIVQDTRLRDAIALYSSIAETAESKRIIAYCVAELQPLMSGRALAADSTYRRGLHALRFLVDAFRGREDLLALYSKQFAEFIGERLAPRADLLLAKNAVEAIGLTSSEDAPALIAKALESRDRWLLETAVRNARYLPRITEQAKELVERYFLTLPRWQLIGRQAAAVRVLALSEHFANMVQRNLWLRLEFVVVVAVFVITALVSPLSLIFSLYLVATLGVVSLAGKLIALIGTEQMLPKVKELIGTEQILAKVKELIGTEWIWDPLLPLRKLGRTLREPECHRRDLSGHLRANTFLGGAAITSSVITIGVAALLLFTEGTEWAFLSPIYFLTANRLEEGLALAVIGLAGLPWYSLVRFAKSQFLHLRLSSLCRLLGIAAVVGAAEIALVWVSNGIPRRLLHVFYITAGIAIGLLILLGVTKALAEYIRGQRQARRWLQRFDGRRATITAAYQDIRTAQGRTTFIAGVAASAPRFRSALESPENVWPDGSRPNRGDAASTRLAQLEEVWLRLDQ